MGRKNHPVPPVNVAVVIGELSKPPYFRRSDQGPTFTSFDLLVKTNQGKADVVRVTWQDAPTWALEIPEGQTVAVVGRVRRYWFGAKQCTTDVLAESVVVKPNAPKIRRLIESVYSALDEAAA